jgi:hypothetical protein
MRIGDAWERAAALRDVAVAVQPEAVVNELTDLPDQPAATNQANARMRRVGTRKAARRGEAGVRAALMSGLPAYAAFASLMAGSACMRGSKRVASVASRPPAPTTR